MNLGSELRHAVRVLWKRPAFTLASVLAVALGVGATTAVFSVVDAVLLRGLPYEDGERLTMVWEANPESGELESKVSPPLLLDLRATPAFSDVAAYWFPEVTLTSREGEPERLRVAEGSANLLSLLGTRPLHGRTFEAGEEGPGRAPQVVLSHGLWQRRYGGDPGVLGTSLSLDDIPHTVIGVMPESFDFPADTDLWRTLGLDPQVIGRRARFLFIVARLDEGVSLQAARQQADSLSDRLRREDAPTYEGWDLRVVSLQEHLVGDVERALLLLFGAIALVLLIAMVNVANLALVRGAARRGEIAMRTVLGSSRRRIARSFLLESLVVSVIGGAVGLVLVMLGIHPLVNAVPAEIPLLDQVTVDWRVLAFSLALVALVGLFVGLIPAVRFAGQRDLASSVKDTGRGGSGVSSLHSILVVVEIAIAMTVLVGAGLLLGSFNKLLQVDPGFDPDGVLTFEVQLPAGKYELGTPVTDFYSQAGDRLESLPGVRSVGFASFFPLDEEAWSLPFAIEGRQAEDEELTARQLSVGSGYFEALGIPILEGRGIEAGDTLESPGVAVVNRTLARRFWGGQSPLDEVLLPGARNFGPLGTIVPDTLRVVGVVGDVKNAGLASEPDPAIYMSHQQFVYRSMNYAVVAERGEPLAVADEVRRQVWSLDPEMPLSNMATADSLISQRLARQRFGSLLLGLFAVIALVLAAVGIYGVVAYGVRQRRREIGIRMALGGSRRDILWLVLRQGLAMTLLGLVLGGAAALASSRLLRDLLYGIAPADPWVYLSIALLLVAVTTLAVLLPARSATRVDPANALRYG